jgi:hypothetical protein
MFRVFPCPLGLLRFKITYVQSCQNAILALVRWEFTKQRSYSRVQPIFLRVCHSPWPGISQTALTYLRGLVVVYLTALGVMLLDFKLSREDDHNEWRIIFNFSTVSFVFLWFYHMIAFVSGFDGFCRFSSFCSANFISQSWTFTHLYYPDIEEQDTRWESVILRRMLPPDQGPFSRKRLYFSIFYTAVHVFVFMNALIHWTIMVPQGHGHWPTPAEPSGDPCQLKW